MRWNREYTLISTLNQILQNIRKMTIYYNVRNIKFLWAPLSNIYWEQNMWLALLSYRLLWAQHLFYIQSLFLTSVFAGLIKDEFLLE